MAKDRKRSKPKKSVRPNPRGRTMQHTLKRLADMEERLQRIERMMGLRK